MEKVDRLLTVLLKLAAILAIGFIVKFQYDQSQNGRYQMTYDPQYHDAILVDTQTGKVKKTDFVSSKWR